MWPNEQQSPAVTPPVGEPQSGPLPVPPRQSPLQSAAYDPSALPDRDGAPRAASMPQAQTVPTMPSQFQPTTVTAASAPSSVQSTISPASIAPQPTPAEGQVADEAVWVERVKSVASQTVNDPYRRLRSLQNLQATYQREHFNRDVNGITGSQ